MKPFLIAAVAAATTAVAIVASASGQSAPTTFTVTESTPYFKYIDVKPFGKEKLSQGDQLAIGGKITGGGSTNLLCTVTKPGKKALFDCAGVAQLAKGDITVAGLSHAATNSDTYAITGGTGDYTGAKGTVKSSDAGGNKEKLVVTITS